MSFKKPFRAVPIEVGRTYRKKQKRERRRGTIRIVLIAFALFIAVFTVGMAITNWPSATAVFARDDDGTIEFQLCGMMRRTCVVDGDTFWLEGRKIRIADIDTPEISEPKCDSEYERGMQATHRLRELLSEGPFQLEPIPGRDKDSYGRELRVVVRNGHSIGDQLVSEGLARTWTGRREPWC